MRYIYMMNRQTTNLDTGEMNQTTKNDTERHRDVMTSHTTQPGFIL